MKNYIFLISTLIVTTFLAALAQEEAKPSIRQIRKMKSCKPMLEKHCPEFKPKPGTMPDIQVIHGCLKDHEADILKDSEADETCKTFVSELPGKK